MRFMNASSFCDAPTEIRTLDTPVLQQRPDLRLVVWAVCRMFILYLQDMADRSKNSSSLFC